MKSLKCCLIATIVIISVLSCSSKTKQKNIVFENGKIIEKVECALDKSTNYALYLPSTYDSTKTYPLIVAFDAHGDGLIPVKLFKDEAEKFGYIIVGSNNSKNGLSLEVTNAIYKSLITDIRSRFSINESRIYTAGFSGGSRVASSIAILNGGIAGVIGFSGGFPNLNQPIKTKFDFLGIVGSSDFNYTEMNQLDKDLQLNGFTHYLLIFEGKHEWPKSEIIPDVFYWLEFCSYRNKLSPINKKLISDFESKSQYEIEICQSKNDAYGEYKLLQKIIAYLNNVVEIDKYKNKLIELEKSTTVQNELKLVQIEVQKEQTLQNYYLDAMNKNDVAWWEKEVKKINNLISENKNNHQGYMLQRVLSYLSMAGYSYSNSTLQSGQLDQSQHFISIYHIIDPENTDPLYFQAVLSAMKNDTLNVFKSLDKAIELGFNDITKLQSDVNFTKFQSMPEWLTLINKISQGKK